MKKILFVTYGGGHVNMVVPVVRKLIAVGPFQIEILGMTTARSVLEKAGLPYFSFSDLSPDLEAIAYGEAMMEGQHGHPLVPWKESVAYMGLSYQCLVEEYGEAEAKKLYLKKGRQAFLPVALMERVIQDGEYDLVVATNSPRTERAAIVAAGNLHIPSVCIVDLFAAQGVKWLGEYGYANKVCVLSNEVKQHLCKAGRKEDEIVVTGNPAFDRLANPVFDSYGETLRKEKGWGEKKVVLWCSQPEPEVHPFTGEKGNPELPMQIEKALKKACDEHQEWQLFVRPHPSENLEQREYLQGVNYGREDDLPSLLKAVDVIVVTSSTVGLEAVLLGKPVVALSMSIFSADMPFSDMGMAEGVDTLTQVEGVLERVLESGYFIDVDLPDVGSAARNIVEEICKLV